MAERTESRQGNVDDDEIKEAVKELTPADTQKIADRVGMSRQAVEYRLKQFDERWQNPVWSKKIGPNVTIIALLADTGLGASELVALD